MPLGTLQRQNLIGESPTFPRPVPALERKSEADRPLHKVPRCLGEATFRDLIAMAKHEFA